MDFSAVFQMLIEKFEKEKIRYALIGGFALHAVGVSRATGDIDFLIAFEDMTKVKLFLQSVGYDATHESEEVSTFVGRMGSLGRVDCLHARRKYTIGMLNRAITKDILGGKIRLKVIVPEDLIGLKVQSSANDPSRARQDMADIENVLKANFDRLDMDVVKEYFSLFGKENELKVILENLHAS